MQKNIESRAMSQPVLYAGDNSLATAASYMAGILADNQLPFTYVPGDSPIGATFERSAPSLFILSDYPAANFEPDDFEFVLEALRRGAGLLMIGGWESFHGLSGKYHDSPLAAALPVRLLDEDDRVNSSRPWLIEPVTSHPITDDLPFRENPTYVGGFNRFTAREGAQTLLQLRKMDISFADDGSYLCTSIETAPLLVTVSCGEGRVAALATDVAPHWVGGFVDWGSERRIMQAAGARQVEVGADYAEFFTRLVHWTMGC